MGVAQATESGESVERHTKPKVIFVAALPPPVHGQSLVNQKVLDTLAELVDATVLDTSPRTLKRSVSYHFRRAFCAFLVVIALWKTRKTSATLYISVNSGLGIAYDLIVVAAARLSKKQLVLHYHSFSYIVRYSLTMATLALLSSDEVTHVFLCATMRDRFYRTYRPRGKSLIWSNGMLINEVTSKTERDIYSGNRAFTVGLLSNLCREKGLYDFLSLLRTARARGMPVRGILAGPTTSARDITAIANAKDELGGALEYRGAVYGENKSMYYDAIDAFLFPTRYAVESYGLVIVEALAHGVPVISFDRGCIGSYLIPPAGYVVSETGDYINEALERISQWIAEPISYDSAHVAATQLSSRLRSEAEEELSRLIKIMVG
jgi:glycosyltransferase involved in cell wall biosynthesis